MNIEIMFEEFMEKEPEILTRPHLTREAIADMYATVEKYRIPVAFVFIPKKCVSEVMKITGELGVDKSALRETVEIGYLGNAWGANYYVVDDLDAIYAVTVHKFLGEKGAVAKLVIGKG